MKRTPFKFVELRRQRAKPVWHDFNCVGCGVRVLEFSDPRISLYLCDDCLDRAVGRSPRMISIPQQTRLAPDWWSLWAIEYESKKAAGLV